MWRLILLFTLTAGPALAHGGHLTNEAWAACAEHQLDDPCEFGQELIHRGTCRSMSDQLVCVRNQPLQRAPAQATLGGPSLGGPSLGGWVGWGAAALGALGLAARRRRLSA